MPADWQQGTPSPPPTGKIYKGRRLKLGAGKGKEGKHSWYVEALQSQISQALFCNANLPDGYNETKLPEWNCPCIPWVIQITIFFSPLTPHVLVRIHSHKGSGSCTILPHLNCRAGGGFLIQYFLFFSLLFLTLFLFLLLDRFIIFYSCLFCTTEGRKMKGRLSVIRTVKGKRKSFLWDVRRCNDDSKNAKYWIPHCPFFTSLYICFLSTLLLPAWLLPAIIKIYNYPKTQVTVFRQHYLHLLV